MKIKSLVENIVIFVTLYGILLYGKIINPLLAILFTFTLMVYENGTEKMNYKDKITRFHKEFNAVSMIFISIGPLLEEILLYLVTQNLELIFVETKYLSVLYFSAMHFGYPDLKSKFSWLKLLILFFIRYIHVIYSVTFWDILLYHYMQNILALGCVIWLKKYNKLHPFF